MQPGQTPPANDSSSKAHTPWKLILSGLAAVLAALLAAFGGDVYKWIKGGVTPKGDPVQVDSVSVHIPPEPGAVFAGEVTATADDLKFLTDNPQKLGEWAHKKGGVGFSDSQSINITLRGNRDHKVRITGMNLVKESCSAPLTGTFFLSPTAGSSEYRALSFDLDSPGSTVASDYFAKKAITVGRGEQEAFTVMTPSKNQSCSFKIEATVLDEDEESKLTIDDNGRPFAVTAGLDDDSKYKALYVGGVGSCPPGGWTRQDPKRYFGGGSSEESCLPVPAS